MGAFKLENGELNIKSVIAIIAVTGTVVIAFFTQVVIPIRDIQAKLTEIQVQMLDQKAQHGELLNQQAEQDKKINDTVNRLDFIERFLKLKK